MLSLEYVSMDESDIALSIPQLEHLALEHFTIENAVQILHANRQLQRLDLITTTEIKFDQLLNMLVRNSSILRLNIVGPITDINEANLNQFSIQCPKIVVLTFTCSLTSDLAFKMINQLSIKHCLVFFIKNDCEKSIYIVILKISIE